MQRILISIGAIVFVVIGSFMQVQNVSAQTFNTLPFVEDVASLFGDFATPILYRETQRGSATPTIDVLGQCPAEITVELTGGTPGGTVGFFAAFNEGTSNFQAGPCDVDLGLDANYRLLSVQTADVAGRAWFSLSNLNDNLCNAYTQVLDVGPGACVLSNVEQLGSQVVFPETKLTASDALDTAFFGQSVSVSGNRVVVGAPEHDNKGKFYVFEFDEVDTWTEVFDSADGLADDDLGWEVAIDGDTAIVGAIREDVDGTSTGGAYIYQDDGTGNWSQITRLAHPGPVNNFERCGTDVALVGDTAMVGCPADRFSGEESGAVHVYYRDQGGADNWGYVTTITASDALFKDNGPDEVSLSFSDFVRLLDGTFLGDFQSYYQQAVANYGSNAAGLLEVNYVEFATLFGTDDAPEHFAFADEFGTYLDVSGDSLVVGSPFNDSCGSNGGAAYVYERNQGGSDNWGETRKIVATDCQAEDKLARVAIDTDTIVAGAPTEDEQGLQSGAAYVFYRDQGGADNWGQITKLLSPTPESEDQFGASVAVGNGKVYVGSPFDDGAGPDYGAFFVFRQDLGGQDAWGFESKSPSVTTTGPNSLGFAIDVDGDRVIVGEKNDDAVAPNAGAAHVFELE